MPRAGTARSTTDGSLGDPRRFALEHRSRRLGRDVALAQAGTAGREYEVGGVGVAPRRQIRHDPHRFVRNERAHYHVVAAAARPLLGGVARRIRSLARAPASEMVRIATRTLLRPEGDRGIDARRTRRREPARRDADEREQPATPKASWDRAGQRRTTVRATSSTRRSARMAPSSSPTTNKRHPHPESSDARGPRRRRGSCECRSRTCAS